MQEAADYKKVEKIRTNISNDFNIYIPEKWDYEV